jgi:hypothetical protein
LAEAICKETEHGNGGGGGGERKGGKNRCGRRGTRASEREGERDGIYFYFY